MKLNFSAVVLSTPFALAAAGCSESAVNTVCPIMGGKIDPANVDVTAIREWKGKKVAFCCPPCLEEWDELTDAEKEERLAHPPSSHDEVSEK